MRRKGIPYYLNTIKLKLANRRFHTPKHHSSYQTKLTKNKELYLDKYQKGPLRFPSFSLYYRTYFYFKNTDIFDESYMFYKGFPVSLKNGEKVPLIPLYYGLVYINTTFNTPEFDMSMLEEIAWYTIKNGEETDECLAYTHAFDYDVFDLEKNWTSGITQAIATSFFLRLYVITKNQDYLQYAKKSFACILSHNERFSCIRVTSSGLEWVEEYKSNPSAYVLSGHIFAIISAGELYQITKDDGYKFHTQNWLRSLVNEFSSYQFESYIIHNKYQEKLSNIEYQGLYIGQFLHLYELTGNDLFQDLYGYYNEQMNWTLFHSFYGIKE